MTAWRRGIRGAVNNVTSIRDDLAAVVCEVKQLGLTISSFVTLKSMGRTGGDGNFELPK